MLVPGLLKLQDQEMLQGIRNFLHQEIVLTFVIQGGGNVT